MQLRESLLLNFIMITESEIRSEIFCLITKRKVIGGLNRTIIAKRLRYFRVRLFFLRICVEIKYAQLYENLFKILVTEFVS